MQKRIIVVEDDFSIAEVLAMILQGEKYKVDFYVNAGFVESLMTDMPSLILLDIWLSGMNGKDLCLQLKKHDLYKQIPIVIMSAHRDIKLYAEEAGSDGYLAKPFDISSLLAFVEKFAG